ncbi:MAG: tRNA lysidine(34) synthetase TilS [Bacteroidales bacterium]
MLKSFLNFFHSNFKIGPEDIILLGISGGVDSIVMLDLFEKSTIQYAIAHCNFGLRGAESDKDEKFVRNLANNNKSTFFVEKFDTAKYAKDNKLSIQMAARELRITWFEKLIKENGFSFYATAHHKDDQIETFFLNLLRSTGISGLHGILLQQGKLIHPMLFASREEILNYASENNVSFRQDSSNLKKDYLRNKIRHDLLPQIKNIKPDYLEILTNNIMRFRQAEEIYKKEVGRAIEKLAIIENEVVKIPIGELLQLHPRETYLYEMISPYSFNISDVNDIFKSLDATPGKQFLSSTHRIIKDREFLILSEINRSSERKVNFSIPLHCLRIESPLKMEFEYIEREKKIEFTDNNKAAMLDQQKLEFPLSIRKWEKGDFFYPFGMNNKKLLSDFFIDQKLSIPEKENTWLLISGKKIAWIIGQRIDNRFKITENTSKILRICIR